MNTRRPIFAPGWISMPVNQRARVLDETGQPLEAQVPQAVRQAVPEDGVQAGIGGQHLEKGARRRIPVEHDADVFPQSGEHWNIKK
jgi:hypothetical protein